MPSKTPSAAREHALRLLARMIADAIREERRAADERRRAGTQPKAGEPHEE